MKYPAGDRRVQAACVEMAGAIAALFQGTGVKVNVKAISLPPSELRKALEKRDYDLLYWHADQFDDPVRLALLFDPAPVALGAGGANFLGCDDVKLQVLIHAPLKHRQFTPAQAGMHAVHAYLNETMPGIPLWQLTIHVLAQPSLRLPALDARLFAHPRMAIAVTMNSGVGPAFPAWPFRIRKLESLFPRFAIKDVRNPFTMSNLSGVDFRCRTKSAQKKFFPLALTPSIIILGDNG